MAGIVKEILEKVQELNQQIDQSVNAEVSQVFRKGASSTSASGQSLPSSSTSTFAESRPGPSRYARMMNLRQRNGGKGSKNVKPKKQDNSPFLRDLILLDGPLASIVPRQTAKLVLIEQGHLLSACEFHKGMSEAIVDATIIEAFEGKIPRDCDIEILMSVHSQLVKPSLAPGQNGINGIILHRLFKNKPVYVRPSKQLIKTDKVRTH